MKKNKLLKGLFCFFILNALAYGFRLDGIDFNQRMDGKDGGYREFRLVNDTKEKQRYRIKVLKGDKNDGSNYIEVFPTVITIEPKSDAVFKLFAKAPSNIKKGLYSFNLEFKPIAIPTLAKAKEGVITGVSNVNIAPVVEMYGYVGDIDFQKELKIENIKIKKLDKENGVNLECKVINTSHAVVEFGILIYGKNNYLLDSKFVTTLGDGKSIDVNINFPNIKNINDIEKLVLYREGNGKVEKLKTQMIED